MNGDGRSRRRRLGLGREAERLWRFAHVQKNHILACLVLEHQVAAARRPLDGEARRLGHDVVDHGLECLILGQRCQGKEEERSGWREQQEAPVHHPITPIRPSAGAVRGCAAGETWPARWVLMWYDLVPTEVDGPLGS